MCGNGARCLVLFARGAGYAEPNLVFETDAGVYRAKISDAGDSVTLYLPPPYPDLDLVHRTIDAGGLHTDGENGEHIEAYPIWTGTEHAVCFTSDVGAVDVARLGTRIRRDPGFAPTGVNVDFVQISEVERSKTTATIHARTFEKGVEAETMACGTGAVAAAIVSATRFLREATTVRVQMPGGVLSVGIQRDGQRIGQLTLEGPAAMVYRGSFDYEA
jgi:diaminopimelate epimerase